MKSKIPFLAVALMTLSVLAGIPLPEHPRPDWERSDWINLNGEWDFGFTKNYDRKILVPFGWGSPLSGVKDEGDTGYYRRSVTVPKEWKGKRVFVIVGASDHDTTCTFGGEELGSYSGGYVPFEFELTDFVKWGEAQDLEFKVWDPDPKTARDGYYLYGKQGYGNVRGIWQTVYLEARGQVYIESARFVPHIASSSVTATVRLGAPAKLKGLVSVCLDEKSESLEFEPGEMEKSVEIKIDNPRLWTLDDPYLYNVKIQTLPSLDPVSSDEVKAYFGFREIGTGKNPNGDSYVTLNGKPIYLQLCLDQSYHPEGYYTFPSDEFMKNEMMISKKLSLSGNRVHIKVEVPRKLYWADKLGLLIQADVPCAWGDVCEQMFAEHWKCFDAMVKRDFNHPSIYQWTLFNETWGLFSNRSLTAGLASGNGGKKRVYREWAQRAVADCYLRAKALDPTRIIEDNSPCNKDHVVTDVNTWHSYRPGYEWEARIDDLCKQTFRGSENNYCKGYVQRGEPMMNSECGNVWGYNGSTGDCDWTWDYHLMINAFRRHLKCAGWLYTEHHDVCNEWNGYVRYDRTWKETGFEELAGMSLADLHRDAALYFGSVPEGSFPTGGVFQPGGWTELSVGVSLTTDKYAGKKLSLCREGWYFNASGRKIAFEEGCMMDTLDARSWHNETFWKDRITFPKEEAAGVIVYSLHDGENVIAKNFYSFVVRKPDTKVKLDEPVSAEWSLGTAKVLDGLKLNGFGKGHFEFLVDAPAAGGTFVAELGAKRKNGKDYGAEKEGGIDRMLGGGAWDRSKNSNSYPQTSAVDKFPANIKVFVDGKPAKEMTLPDDPADSRGFISWLSQPWDRTLHEAGSYGYLVEVPVPADAVKDGKVRIRIESDNGLAVYGPAFGRFPFGPSVRAK